MIRRLLLTIAMFAVLAHGTDPRRATADEPAATATPIPYTPQPLVPTASPAVQMFVPGFVVRALPLELTNINNVRYRPDGKLLALAYDGNIYVLSDTDGDGLEDNSRLFWHNQGQLRDPIGMALTPPGYPHGSGVFVTSAGQCSLIVDTNGDDEADQLRVVAEGWRQMPNGLAAIGVAVDPRDGSVYLGVGAADYTNPYEIDDQGVGHYDLADERGTILRVAPDLGSREIVCTGIRFPVGLAFDARGELFCTDQEGATWLANGNPFDELLHIQRGRHYGFPPRHPRHLPEVIDEPSAFDYAPQHQSTCGLLFNQSVNNGPVFGPGWWAGDAIVCGYSRGKLFRTKLVYTAAGYTAQTQRIGCLNMLTVDACVAPDGGLVVSAHSGQPDWGTGPGGQGRLYKIDYRGTELPQPVVAYAASPTEVRVAFDRPLGTLNVDAIAQQASISFGEYVRAGDRFESLAPGYVVVAHQKASPRYELPVEGVSVADDGQTLVLATAPHPAAAHYAVTIAGLRGVENNAASSAGLPQHPHVDLEYDLGGVVVDWRDADGNVGWHGWLPHVDLSVARALLPNSAEHDQLWQRLERNGTLTLRTSLDLTDMLRPAVQPLSEISYKWPAETVTLVLRAPRPLDVTCAGVELETSIDADGWHVVSLIVPPERDRLVPIEIGLPTGGERADLSVSFHTAEDARPRTLALRRLRLPWAAELPVSPAPPASLDREVAELDGGNWLRGHDLFFSERAKCGNCHRVAGRGAPVGPDLSNLVHRDYKSVLRDITEPSAAINPDYLTFNVVLDDGRALKGSIRTIDGQALIADASGKVTTFEPEAVEGLEPLRTSIMPEEVVKELTPGELTDLMTFLLTPAPQMPNYGGGTPPPPHRRAEVDAVLQGAPEPLSDPRPIHIVLVAGAQDHGPGEHDYPAWQHVWSRLLAMSPNTQITTAIDWPSAEQFAAADVIVFYQRGAWTADRAATVDGYLARGGGLVYIHWAVDGRADVAGLARRIGLASDGDVSRYRHGQLDLHFDSDHPIARHFDKLRLVDESYWRLSGDARGIGLLATGIEEEAPQPLCWTFQPAGGRVFVSIPGHFAWTFDDPLFRILLLRGIAWAAGEPVDRFNELATAGARIVD